MEREKSKAREGYRGERMKEGEREIERREREKERERDGDRKKERERECVRERERERVRESVRKRERQRKRERERGGGENERENIYRGKSTTSNTTQSICSLFNQRLCTSPVVHHRLLYFVTMIEPINTILQSDIRTCSVTACSASAIGSLK